MTNKPITLMPEDIQRIIGKDAQRNNIAAAKLVAEIVKTTLGPRGMDKMLVSPLDDIIITNDGATILSEMQIEHPAAKMMVEIAKTQESEVGDGTTSAVMIAGKLLENAEKLLDKKIHPIVIVKGYRIAAEKAQDILKELSLEVDHKDEFVLKQIAMTAMTGKGAEDSKENLSDIVVKAVNQIEENGFVDLDNIKIEKARGEGIGDSELISGIVIDKGKITLDMPSYVKNARIALIDIPLELKSPELKTEVSISSPEQLQRFLLQEENSIKEIVNLVRESTANVVFCQKGVDDFASFLLARNGIYVCRRVARSDMHKIAKATGAKIISNLNDLTQLELGSAENVENVKRGNDFYTYIQGCKNPKAVTILIHGGSDHVMDEIERAIDDGLGDVSCVLKSGLVVPGGGAIEMEVSRRLKQFGQTISGRERLAVEEFANALEFIPLTLAENAGLDPIDIITELRAKHDSGDKNAGLNLFENKVANVLEAKIIEPYNIKSQEIDSATEVANMILRIDDVIASKPDKRGKMSFTGERGREAEFMSGLE
ncbi:MAG: Thermosome subunit [Candidatus Diapherotrites archaeon ADurb.Bin253]|nr:MAG: Thermosome subunit [Candidatus Diapherotrites archaeon ADurb.Bin253]HNZ51914.1 thermosome subunit alpha [Candidatus Pacearchaeota archaeon]